jgi:acid phosphatase type 7
VASSTGRRVRWGPLAVRPWADVRLLGSGFRPGERVRVSLFGRRTRVRASRRGRIRVELAAPRDTGRRRGAVRARGVSLPLSVSIAGRGSGAPGSTPVTPPPPGVGPGGLGASGDPVVAAAGDIACDPTSSNFLGGPASCRQWQTSDLLLDPAIDTVLALGDLQYEHGSLAEFTNSYSLSWGKLHLKAITRPVLGNHEYQTGGAAGYFDYFNGVGGAIGPAGTRGQGWYSFDLGAWHLVALNSNCGAAGGCGPGSPQETWLRADLAANPRACTLAYIHHPRFSSGVHGSFTNVQPLWQALYDAGADVVLAGHDHNYERYLPQDAAGTADLARGLREFVVGTGGRNLRAFPGAQPANSEVRDANAFGVLELALHPTSYEWEFVPAAGSPAFTDRGLGACH